VTLGDDLRWISGYISSKEEFSPPLWASRLVVLGSSRQHHPALPLTNEAALLQRSRICFLSSLLRYVEVAGS